MKITKSSIQSLWNGKITSEKQEKGEVEEGTGVQDFRHTDRPMPSSTNQNGRSWSFTNHGSKSIIDLQEKNVDVFSSVQTSEERAVGQSWFFGTETSKRQDCTVFGEEKRRFSMFSKDLRGKNEKQNLLFWRRTFFFSGNGQTPKYRLPSALIFVYVWWQTRPFVSMA